MESQTDRLLTIVRFLEIATNNRFMAPPEATAIWKQELKNSGFKEHPRTAAQKAVDRKVGEQ